MNATTADQDYVLAVRAAMVNPQGIGPRLLPNTGPILELAKQVARNNKMTLELYQTLPWVHPVGQVFWVHCDKVQANDYNPNAVPVEEMKLLHTSIAEDGYTQPIVAVWDPELGKAVIVDGFHRYSTMKMFSDIFSTTNGYLPIVILEKSISDRIAATVRHNRARGAHSVAGMGNLVYQMLAAGESDATICQKIGLDSEELARLKHITGFSKLFAKGGPNEAPYSKVVLTGNQMREKAEFKKEHPDEPIPQF